MSRKVAVVTGATGGIGRSVALGLARADCHVVMVGRDQGRADAAEEWVRSHHQSAETEIFLADLSSLAETRQLAQAILATHPAISILINNAGVFSEKRRETAEGHEYVLAVNHLSPFVLTNTLLPGLQAASAARIVTVGSDTSDRAAIDPANLELTHGWNLVSAYRRAKLAQMMTTFVLADRLAGSGITANVVHPGAVATGLIRAKGPIGIAWKLMASFMLSEEEGADTPVFASLSPMLDGVTGQYFKKRKAVRPNRLALDKALIAKVWAETEKLVG